MPLCSGIAVWPDTVEFESHTGHFTVYNNLNEDAQYDIIASGVEPESLRFVLPANKQKQLTFELKEDNANIIINEQVKGVNVVNSVAMRVKIGSKKTDYKKYFLLIIPLILIIILVKSFIYKKNS